MNAVSPALVQVAYLGAAALFIVGLRALRTPATAPRGNLLAAGGMLLAVVATLVDRAVLHYDMILLGLIIGTLAGTLAARRVHMTAMPQMVAVLNGLGGGASVLVALGEAIRRLGTPAALALDLIGSSMLGVLIGGVTFTGSMVAAGKLQGLVPGAPVLLPYQRPLQGVMLLVALASGLYGCLVPGQGTALFVLLGVALLTGVCLVLPIGAADMPVVIAFLNACSGLAASAVGFVVRNDLLIIAGALVGASGVILSQLMCHAMHRSLGQVLLGAFGTGELAPGTTTARERPVHAIDVEEAAMVLAYARQVVIVPGYGMAVAQAQHAVHDLAALLTRRGIDVQYAIHPVAGRMPGHMNVLLAEANVPYTMLRDLEDINPAFAHTDVVLIIGANDIVNPAARDDPHSPLYGMPILDVDKASHIIMIKRSLNPGFAGIDNALFYHPKTLMLFGDARQVLYSLNNEVKRL